MMFPLRVDVAPILSVPQPAASIDELQRQYADSNHHAADDTQPARLEQAHLFDHSLPGLRRREQQQTLDHENQAQGSE